MIEAVKLPGDGPLSVEAVRKKCEEALVVSPSQVSDLSKEDLRRQ